MITLILYTGESSWRLGVICDNDTQITHRKRGKSKMLHHRVSSAFTFQPPGSFQMKMIAASAEQKIAETF